MIKSASSIRKSNGMRAYAVRSRGVIDGPLNKGRLHVGAVNSNAVELREFSSSEGPPRADTVPLFLPLGFVVRTAPHEAVATKQLVSAVSDHRVLVPKVPHPLEGSGNHERIAQRHPVKGIEQFDTGRKICFHKIIGSEVDDVVLQPLLCGGGSGEILVRALRAGGNGDAALERDSSLGSCFENRARVYSPRENKHAALGVSLRTNLCNLSYQPFPEPLHHVHSQPFPEPLHRFHSQFVLAGRSLHGSLSFFLRSLSPCSLSLCLSLSRLLARSLAL